MCKDDTYCHARWECADVLEDADFVGAVTMAILRNFFHRVPRSGEMWWGAKVRRWQWKEVGQEEESRHKHTLIFHQCCLTDASLRCVTAVTVSSLPCHQRTNSRHEKNNIYYHRYLSRDAFWRKCELLFLSLFFFVYLLLPVDRSASFKVTSSWKKLRLASEQSVVCDVSQPTQELMTVRSDNMSTYVPKCASKALKNYLTLKCADGCNACPLLMRFASSAEAWSKTWEAPKCLFRSFWGRQEGTERCIYFVVAQQLY